MSNRGKKIVLAASTSESSEYLNSTWRQMLLGTLPSRYTRFPFYMIDVNWKNEVREDGQTVGVPLYYYLMGRRRFGKQMKYPLMRLAHFPESILQRRLYLDLRKPGKFSVPESVEIPQPKARPVIPADLELV